MALSAPSIICLKSEFNKKYMRYQEATNLQTHDLLQFTSNNVFDPYVQIEVVKATVGDDLFHLKCRYNNKFFVRWVPDRNWISASAARPNEDTSSWTCTLFKPSFVIEGDTTKIRLEHVHLGCNLIIWTAPSFDSYLFVGSSEDKDPKNRDVFSVVDWTSLFLVPKRAAFKADNGMYLGVVTISGRKHLQFSFKDVKHPSVENEIIRSKDGMLCILNKSEGKYWVYNKGDTLHRILVEGEDPRVDNNVNGMFRPNTLGPNRVGLLSMARKWYCQRHTADGLTSLLRVVTQNVNQWTPLDVIDLYKVN